MPALNINPRELAALLGIAPATAYNACARGEIPAQRVGTRWLIRVADIKARFGATDADIAKAREEARTPARVKA